MYGGLFFAVAFFPFCRLFLFLSLLPLLEHFFVNAGKGVLWGLLAPSKGTLIKTLKF